MEIVFGGGGSSGAELANVNCEVTISEAGLFNSVSAGTDQMFAHQSFGAITLLTADTLEVEWQISIT